MDKNSSDGVPLPQRYGAILTIVLGLTMAVLDGAIANVALPTIASDLNASPAASIWIVNAYQIAIVIALLPLSFLGDMVGYRRIYKIGLVVFIFTSLACALSRSLEMLTFARVAQGLGGAALMSVNTALIRLIYPQRFLGRGMGINSFVVAVSSAAGPTIAAAILSLASWQWLFLINVPLGIVAFVLAMRFLPPNSARSKIIRFDLPSAIMNALTFGLLITALSGFAQGSPLSWCWRRSPLCWWWGSSSFAASSRCPSPCCRSTCCVSHSSLSLSALPSAPSARRCWRWSPALFLQSMMGRSEVETGLLLTPWPLATMVMAPLAGYLIEKCHAGLLGAIGLLIMACGLFGLALLPSSPSDLDIIWRMALCGAGFGLFQSPNNHTIVASAPSHRSGGASGMLGTARLLGQSTGAALVALLFNLLGNNGTHTALLLAGTTAIVAALISGLRVTQPRAA